MPPLLVTAGALWVVCGGKGDYNGYLSMYPTSVLILWAYKNVQYGYVHHIHDVHIHTNVHGWILMSIANNKGEYVVSVSVSNLYFTIMYM